MSEDKKKNRRIEGSAQKALQEPITAAQTVSGWVFGIVCNTAMRLWRVCVSSMCMCVK